MNKRVVLLIILVLINLAILDYQFLFGQKKTVLEVFQPTPTPAPFGEKCDSVCQELVDEKIASALATIVVKKETPVAPTASLPKTSYLPLGNGGSTADQSWTKIEGSDFVFNLADYSTSAKAYWNGNLKARDANTRCYARIYDKTNLRAVDFSEQSTDKTDFESLTSQALSIWRGSNNYYLELKSLNGIPCYLSSPRLLVRY